MKDVFSIYQKDMKSIVTNVMTAILIGGLIFLPSLYAWVNIKASWDPYGQTEQIPIGFVNEDEGATIRGESVHVGNDLQENLEENDSFDWQFLSRDEGVEGVELGDLYALLVVPEDFSEQLGSVVSGEPEKADMEYYVNEKINAIAPKITDKGASVIVEEISSEFISVVNGIIFEMFNDIGLELEDNLPDIEQFEEYVFTLEDELPNIHDKLEETDDQLGDAHQMLTDANEQIPEVKRVVGEGLEAIQTANEFLDTVETNVQGIGPVLEEEVEKIEGMFGDVEAWKKQMEDELENEREDIDITGQLNETTEQLEEAMDSLKEVQESLDEPNENIAEIIESMETVDEELQKVQDYAEDIDSFIDENESMFTQLNETIDELDSVDLSAFVEEYESSIEPAILDELAKGKETISDAETMMYKVEDAIPKVEEMIGSTQNKLNEGQELIDKALDRFPVIQDRVHTLAENIRSFQSEADLKDIIELLLNDPEAEKSFFSEPVKLHKNEVFPIPNYGTGMTPFYTVLALWVGTLLLISLLSPNVPEGDKLNPKVIYGGRLLTFLTIGILQTIIVTMGDMWIVGVPVEHPLAFILFGVLISIVFMTIVYTAIAVLGDVGKAVAIILLVLQIASSGGTYPVPLLPEFFQALHPFLPFTYAVDLMREAVGGIIWPKVWKDIGSLSIFAILFILIGTFLKGPVQAKMSKAMKSKGGRLF